MPTLASSKQNANANTEVVVNPNPNTGFFTLTLSSSAPNEVFIYNPKNEKGIRKHRHHSLTSEEIGLPKIRAQIWQVVGVLKMSANKRKFESNYNRMMGQSYQTDAFED